MKTLNEIFTILIAIASIFGVLLLVATFTGTLVWLLWPMVIPNVFPRLVANGSIVGMIEWWHAVCFTWMIGILLNGNVSTKKDE